MINPQKGIDLMNNISIINRILFAVTLFQHSPLTRRVFYNNIKRGRGQHHQQHQVGDRTTSSISSWNTDWHIYKSSKVFLIDNIVIISGMKSSYTSIWISIKLIHHHHNTRLAHHHNTGLALCHGHKVGSTVLIFLYITTIKLEARYSSCFTSQQSSWKQDTRMALRHSFQARSSMLVSSHCLYLRHNH